MSGKLYSLNTRSYIAELLPVLTNYSKHHNQLMAQGSGEGYTVHHNQLYTAGIQLITPTRKSATALVHALVKNDIDSYLAYRTSHNEDHALAEALFGEGTHLTPTIKYFIDDFLTVDEVDNLVVDIDLQLSHILERNTWVMVDVLDLDTSISVVVNEDLRIHEWKQMNGYAEEYGAAVDLDLSQMVHYLNASIDRQYASCYVMHDGKSISVKPSSLVDFKPILLDLLVCRYPYLRKENQLGPADPLKILIAPKSWDTIVTDSSVDANFQGFIRAVVQPAVENYAVFHYLNRLNQNLLYEVSINNKFRLTATLLGDTDNIKGCDKTKVKELCEAYLRGDYLPPKEREEAERHLQDLQ